MSIDKTKAKDLHSKFLRVLNDFASEHNLEITGSPSARYNETEISFNKINLKLKGIQSSTELRKERRASMMGVEIGGKYHIPSLGEVTVVDYNTRARKYPFIVKDDTGKQYKVSENQLMNS